MSYKVLLFSFWGVSGFMDNMSETMWAISVYIVKKA